MFSNEQDEVDSDEELPPEPKPLTIVSRKEWEALPPRKVDPLAHPVTTIVFTYDTEVKTCYNQDECSARMRELQTRYLEDTNNSDIDFNFLIGGDGFVYEGRGWDVRSSENLKPSRYHGKRIDIAWIGANVGTDYIPQNVLRPAYQLIRKGIQEGKIVEKYILYENRHRPVSETYYYHPLYYNPEYL